jgi:hypothetical protein
MARIELELWYGGMACGDALRDGFLQILTRIAGMQGSEGGSFWSPSGYTRLSP